MERVGKLSCFSGTVTRTSEVRPELYLGAFRCLDCNTVVGWRQHKGVATCALLLLQQPTSVRQASSPPALDWPQLAFVTACMQVRGVQQQFKYTEPVICTNATCGNRKAWSLVRDESTFVDWQRVKVQEDPAEVPGGSLPRTMDVIVRHQQVSQWLTATNRQHPCCSSPP